MRIARFALREHRYWAAVEGEPGHEVVIPLAGDVLNGQAEPIGDPRRLRDITLLPPVVPSKIVAVGRNYADHTTELGSAAAERPRIFFKPPSSVITHGQPIRHPSESQEVHHEAELAVIIGQPCRRVSPEDAQAFIFGYTCANDVTAMDIQRADGLLSYAKSFDTFCPLGPWVTTDLDPTAVRITCTVNDQLRQDGNTRDLLWGVPELIAHISAAMTLLPGDVVLTGTPAGVGLVRPGDEVAVTVKGIGTLRNPVVRDLVAASRLFPARQGYAGVDPTIGS